MSNPPPPSRSPTEGVVRLQKPPECDLFSDEVFTGMDEEEQRLFIRIYSRKKTERSAEGLRIRNLIVGDGNPNFPPAPYLLPDDFEGPVESLGCPMRIFTDPSAKRELLEIANKYHWEMERKEREAMLRGEHFANVPGSPTPTTAAGKAEKDPLPSMDLLLSRDVRDWNTLSWLPNHRIHGLSETLLGPMRYTCCELGERCLHDPSPMLQILDIFVESYMHSGIAGPYIEIMPDDSKCWHVDVYGTIATIDCLDFARNYIFHRSREDAQAIIADGGYLRLRNPAKGISAMNCLIEIDIRIKAEEFEEDETIVNGCVKAVGQFDPWGMNHVDSTNGRVIFESCVLVNGVEATIELDFVEVPAGGFHVRMCGKTALSKSVYYFIEERCRDCNSFIASSGKYGQKFVAAVSISDTLFIDFLEKGRDALSFAASKHGNEQQMYRFSNGAVVSVQVFWSTIETVGLVDSNATELNDGDVGETRSQQSVVGEPKSTSFLNE